MTALKNSLFTSPVLNSFFTSPTSKKKRGMDPGPRCRGTVPFLSLLSFVLDQLGRLPVLAYPGITPAIDPKLNATYYSGKILSTPVFSILSSSTLIRQSRHLGHGNQSVHELFTGIEVQL